MSWNMERKVPKTPNPYAKHATSAKAAEEIVADKQHADMTINPFRNGYTQSEYVRKIELVAETDAEYTFKVYISGD
jgi:hypothetical protein